MFTSRVSHPALLDPTSCSHRTWSKQTIWRLLSCGAYVRGSDEERKRGHCDFPTPNQLLQADAKNAQLSSSLGCWTPRCCLRLAQANQ